LTVREAGNYKGHLLASAPGVEMPMQPPFPCFTVVALPCGEHATQDLDARRPMRALLEVGGEGS
jgi:hypothetical protein